jgi:hypothetical protein
MDPATGALIGKAAEPFIAAGMLGAAIVALSVVIVWLYVHKEKAEDRCRKQVETSDARLRELETKRLELVLEIANRATALIERNTTQVASLSIAVEAARASTGELARGFAAMAAANEDAQDRLTERSQRMEANQAAILVELNRRSAS